MNYFHPLTFSKLLKNIFSNKAFNFKNNLTTTILTNMNTHFLYLALLCLALVATTTYAENNYAYLDSGSLLGHLNKNSIRGLKKGSLVGTRALKGGGGGMLSTTGSFTLSGGAGFDGGVLAT